MDTEAEAQFIVVELTDALVEVEGGEVRLELSVSPRIDVFEEHELECDVAVIGGEANGLLVVIPPLLADGFEVVVRIVRFLYEGECELSFE